MLIGIDHIALSTLDIDRGKEILSDWGYRTQFLCKNLLNSEAKKEYIAEMNKYHDIVYCKSKKDGLSIELVRYGNKFLEEKHSPYSVVFGGRNPVPEADFKKPLSSKMEDLHLVFDKRIKPIWLDEFKTGVYYLGDREPRSESTFIKFIILFCKDLGKTISFWEDIGLSVVGKGKKHALLQFKSVFPSLSINMAVIETGCKNVSPTYKIDYPGFNCIAFLVKDIQKERKRLMALGRKIGDIFDFTAGDNLLKICLLEGVNGECAELIQVIKKIPQGP